MNTGFNIVATHTMLHNLDGSSQQFFNNASSGITSAPEAAVTSGLNM